MVFEQLYLHSFHGFTDAYTNSGANCHANAHTDSGRHANTHTDAISNRDADTDSQHHAISVLNPHSNRGHSNVLPKRRHVPQTRDGANVLYDSGRHDLLYDGWIYPDDGLICLHRTSHFHWPRNTGPQSNRLGSRL